MLVIVYLAAVVAANLLAATYGPSITPFVGFAFIGLDITTRDLLHERWQHRHLLPKMALLIAWGSLLSYAVNQQAGPIAFASFAAFALSATADTALYHAMRRAPWLARVNGSNALAALVDSLAFPYLAFGAFLPAIVAGQFVAKVAGGAFWSWVAYQAKQRRRVALA